MPTLILPTIWITTTSSPRTLEAAAANPNPEVFLAALGDVAKALGSGKLAKGVNSSRSQ
jgi:hypothetical protein